MISFNTNVSNVVKQQNNGRVKTQTQNTQSFKNKINNPDETTGNGKTIKNALLAAGLLTSAILCFKNKNLLKQQFNKALNNIKRLFNKKTQTIKPQPVKPQQIILPCIGPNEKSLIKAKLKPYLNSLKDGENIDPAKLDELLTELVGRNNVREQYFFPNPLTGVTKGRKKTYKLGSRIITLETHNGRHGVVTRVYDNKNSGIWVQKPDRSYMLKDGSFIEDAYYSGNAHLPSGSLGETWIDMAA